MLTRQDAGTEFHADCRPTPTMLHGPAGRARVMEGSGIELSVHCPETPTLPSKADDARRHHGPAYRTMNPAACETAPRDRGGLTVWFTDTTTVARAAAPRGTRA